MAKFDPSRREAMTTALAAPVALAAALQPGRGAFAAASRDAVHTTQPSTKKANSNMLKYQVGDQKGLDSLQFTDGPVPEPGPGEVRIAVKASALNHRDLMVMSGRYGGPKPPTF